MRCGKAAKDCQLIREMLVALKHTVVSTIGGVDYEGFPTSEINYLQRLRILLEKEKQLQSLQSRAETAEGELEITQRSEHILREALEKQRVRMNAFSAGAGCNPLRATEEINRALEQAQSALERSK